MKKDGIKQRLLAWAHEEVIVLAAGLCFVSSIFLLVNHFLFHYSGLSYLSWSMVKFIPWAMGVFFIAAYIRDDAPRIALFFSTIGKLYFLYLLMSVLCRGAQYTLFHLIDPTLHRFDLWLGYHAGAELQFSQSHRWVEYLSKIVYQFPGMELFLLPILLSFLFEKRSIPLFFVANFIVALMGFCFIRR
jgi:hypothetical protein